MIKVRKNVFETNSSSTHSITIEDSEHRNFENERNSTLILNFSGDYFYKTDKYNRNSLSTLGLHKSFSEENIYNRLKQIIFDDRINFRHQHIEC